MRVCIDKCVCVCPCVVYINAQSRRSNIEPLELVGALNSTAAVFSSRVDMHYQQRSQRSASRDIPISATKLLLPIPPSQQQQQQVRQGVKACVLCVCLCVL